MKRLSLVLFTIFLLSTVACYSGTVTLAWDYLVTQESDLVGGGFKIYQKKLNDANYPASTTLTAIPSLRQITLTVSPGSYCWTATAYTPDVESDKSNEVCSQVTPNKPLNLRIP
jgi:hypothetical protein